MTAKEARQITIQNIPHYNLSLEEILAAIKVAAQAGQSSCEVIEYAMTPCAKQLLDLGYTVNYSVTSKVCTIRINW